MKTIRTLVQDIDDLFSKDVVATEEQVEGLGRSITDMLKRRLSAPSVPRGLSMSNFGSRCKRQLWYKVNKPELAEPLDSKTKRNFLAGDIWEELMIAFAKWSGHDVKGEQTKMNLHGLEGHRDCVIDGVTVDVKTANSRSIEKFKRHDLEKDDPFGYLSQLECYVAAGADDPVVIGKREGAFLVVDKERGDLVLDRYVCRDQDYEEQIEGLRTILSDQSPPARRYRPVADGKSGNEVLDVACRYCPFKEECWKDTNKGQGLIKYLYSTGPRWFTKLVKEPRVERIPDPF